MPAELVVSPATARQANAAPRVAARSQAQPAQALQVASLARAGPQHWVLAGRWTALHLGDMEHTVDTLMAGAGGAPSAAGETDVPDVKDVKDVHDVAGDGPLVVDASQLTALDSAGAWVLQNLLLRLQPRAEGEGDGEGQAQVATAGAVVAQGLSPQHLKLLQRAAAHTKADPAKVAQVPATSALQTLGRKACTAGAQGLAMLSLLGEVAATFAAAFRHPTRWRWRQVLFNIRISGFDALPIVGLLAFLLGIVVAYQSADQLRQFGANIFIVDVVGLSMLREFAPMMTAIIIAGRSGSAYAAQIGTMAVTEEIDAMRTLGISPLEQLVLPKVISLVIALPLLTFFADVMGVLGGMLMAQLQLGVGYEEFIDRFTKAVSVTAFLVGIGKAPVFAVIIVVVGCFQGLQTRGGADSVGRQTTRAVVQSTFMVIVADALFSIVFSALDL